MHKTGKPCYEPEAEAWADHAGTGKLQRRYCRTAFEPVHNAQGQVTEVLNFVVDVTAQVETRRQVEQLDQELQRTNQERQAASAALTQAQAANEAEAPGNAPATAGHPGQLCPAHGGRRTPSSSPTRPATCYLVTGRCWAALTARPA